MFSATFKTKVAIEALKKRESLSEIAKRYKIHPDMISQWKREFVDIVEEIYLTQSHEIEKLYAKIKQLEMERDSLKKVSPSSDYESYSRVGVRY